jgi:hypothetical protein
VDKQSGVKFTALDAIIIAGAVTAAVMVFLFFNIRTARGEPVWIDFTFESRGVDIGFYGIPSVGDDIYDSVRGGYLGVVTDVLFEPSLIITVDVENQVLREVVMPDRLNMFITIRGQGTETDDRITISGSGYEIRVGTHMFVKGRGYASEGFCVNLKTSIRGD